MHQGRHENLIGKWVVIDGVRTSYRGVLLSVQEMMGEAILHFHPCFALEALADTTNEVKLPSTPDVPWQVYTQAILAIGLQPFDWKPRD